jgi:hypothetical protein
MKKLEYIKWMDHSGFSESRWRAIEEVQDLNPIMMHTVGWVIYEDKDKLVTVSTMHDDEETVHSEFCIVKKAIVHRRQL